MNKAIYTQYFKSRAKRLLNKFSTLKNELIDLESQLLKTPTLGTALGNGLYKIRLGTKSKGGGKSGGFRVITYLIEENENSSDIYFITIYDKSEEATLDKKMLLKIIKNTIE